jgi:organic radical activating enzyme
MKIIKIHNPKAEKYKLIEWKLHNVCNYNCNFCGPKNKLGDENWLPIEFYLDRIDKFIAIAEAENKKLWFTLTGGEPTLMPNFNQIPAYIKQKGHHVQIQTNGSRTIRWWEEFASTAQPDILLISLHAHQGADASHIAKITELFKDSLTTIWIVVTAPPENFEDSFKNFNYLIDNAVGMISLRGIILIKNSLSTNYTEAQREILKKSFYAYSKRWSEKTHKNVESPWNNINVVFDDGHEEINHGQNYILRGLYNFFGWKCTTGQDYIRIEHTKIYRGNCGQDGVIGDLMNSDFGFADGPTICTVKGCTCSIEWSQPKFKL